MTFSRKKQSHKMRKHRGHKTMRRTLQKRTRKGGARDRKPTLKGKSYQASKTIEKGKRDSRTIHKQNMDDLTSMFEGLSTNRITRQPSTTTDSSLDDVFTNLRISRK